MGLLELSLIDSFKKAQAKTQATIKMEYLFMKKTIISAFVLSSSLALADAPVTDEEKLGYTFGNMVGSQLGQAIKELDIDAFTAGFNAAYSGSEPELSQEEMAGIFQAFQQEQIAQQQREQERLAEEAKAKSSAWLAEREAEDGVQKTESGLLYKEINAGSGKTPAATDTVKVNYEGSLADGTVFDSSYERGEPISFPLNQVISGWTEGVQLMKVGAKYELYIPSELAYGPGGTGPIPPHSALKFVVELLDIETAEQ